MGIAPVERAFIADTVSTPGVAASNATGEAVQQLGNTLAATGFSIYDKVKSAEAETASQIQYTNDIADIERKKIDLMTRQKNGYVLDEQGNNVFVVDENGAQRKKTVSEAFKEWADTSFTENQNKMPTKYAQDLYIEKARMQYAKNYEDIISKEHLAIVEGLKEDQKILFDRQQKAQLTMYNTPVALSDFKSNIDLLQRQANSGLITPDVANAMAVQGNSDLASRWIDSVIDKSQNYAGRKDAQRVADLKALREVVRDSDSPTITLKNGKKVTNTSLGKFDPNFDNAKIRAMGGITIAGALTPEKQAEYLRKIDGMIEEARQKDVSDDMAVRAQGLNDVRNGRLEALSVVNETTARLAQHALEQGKPNMGTIWNSENKAALVIGTLTKSAQGKLPSEILEMSPNLQKQVRDVGGVKASIPQEEVQKTVEYVAKKTLQEIKDDPKKWINSNRSTGVGEIAWGTGQINKYTPEQLKASYDRLDETFIPVKNQDPVNIQKEYFTNTELQSLSGIFKSRDQAKIENVLKDFQRTSRENEMIDNLVSHKILDPEWKAVPTAQGTLAYSAVVRTLLAKNEIESTFKNSGKSEVDVKNVSPELLDMMVAASKGSEYSTNSAVLRDLLTKTAVLMRKEQVNQGKEASDEPFKQLAFNNSKYLPDAKVILPKAALTDEQFATLNRAMSDKNFISTIAKEAQPPIGMGYLTKQMLEKQIVNSDDLGAFFSTKDGNIKIRYPAHMNKTQVGYLNMQVASPIQGVVDWQTTPQALYERAVQFYKSPEQQPIIGLPGFGRQWGK